MCCNGSKKSALQLHAVASTWFSYVLLSIQRLFLGMCADLGLIIYGSDATDAYAHLLAPNATILSIDDAYATWYENKFNKKIDRRMVLPVYHALQGHPESGKQWMHMIDSILINKMGFHTTTHDRCIYRRVLKNGSVQLLLRQVDDFLLACESKEIAENIFQDIGNAIRFPSEERDGITPFEFLGVVKDYNGVDIKQTKDYIEMSCANYLRRLLKSHGQDTESSKPVPSDVNSVVASEESPNSINAADDAADHSITHRVHDFDDASCEINDFPTARTNLRDLAIPMEICVTRQIWCQPRAQRVILQIFYVTRQIWCQPRACNLMFARFTNLREVRSHVPYLLFN